LNKFISDVHIFRFLAGQTPFVLMVGLFFMKELFQISPFFSIKSPPHSMIGPGTQQPIPGKRFSPYFYYH
jgi:hypothetical protein